MRNSHHHAQNKQARFAGGNIVGRSPGSAEVKIGGGGGGGSGGGGVTSPKQFVRVKTEMNEDGTPVKTSTATTTTTAAATATGSTATRDLLKEVGNKGDGSAGGKSASSDDGEVVDESAAATTWDPSVALTLPEDYDGQLVSPGEYPPEEENAENDADDYYYRRGARGGVGGGGGGGRGGYEEEEKGEVEYEDCSDIQFLIEIPKIRLLQSLEDPGIGDRTNPHYKLFTSALYDVAKAAAVASPSADKTTTKGSDSPGFF